MDDGIVGPPPSARVVVHERCKTRITEGRGGHFGKRHELLERERERRLVQVGPDGASSPPVVRLEEAISLRAPSGVSTAKSRSRLRSWSSACSFSCGQASMLSTMSSSGRALRSWSAIPGYRCGISTNRLHTFAHWPCRAPSFRAAVISPSVPGSNPKSDLHCWTNAVHRAESACVESPAGRRATAAGCRLRPR